jgi:hypothetical protein
MGRRDLIRRERAKLAAAEPRTTTELGPEAPLPAWLGTATTFVPRSQSTRARSIRDAATATPRPVRRTTRLTRSGYGGTGGRLTRRPFESESLRELVRRRDEARLTVRSLDGEIADEVERARAAGAVWTDIAACLATTRQGARQRYGPGGTHARPVRSWSTDRW